MDELVGIGADSLPRFLERWYGSPSGGHDPASVLASGRLPTPLLRWYDLRAMWSLPWRRHNEMIPADDLELDDGMFVFWVENQAVTLWGYPPRSADPQVHERYNEEGEPWRPTGEPLSRFLVFIEVMEALMAPQFGALSLAMEPGDVRRVIRGTRLLEGPLWRLPGGQAGCDVRAGADTLVMLLPGDAPGTSSVYLAVRTESMLADFDFGWDWHSSDDQ